MDLLLFGIQGSGKGTQAKKIAEEFGYRIFEAGAALRAIAASGTPLGNTVQGYIDQGHLAPHAVVMQVLEEAIMARPITEKILFDGIPRDSLQQQDFDRIMTRSGREFFCIELRVDPAQAFSRILGRAQKESRADDADPERIQRRMDLFREKTSPVIEQYRKEGKMVTVDGEGSVEEVYARLHTVLCTGFRV
jgi:adenylate kinase